MRVLDSRVCLYNVIIYYLCIIWKSIDFKNTKEGKPNEMNVGLLH